MMPLKFICFFTILMVFQPAWSLTLDWTGFARLESYYSQSVEKDYYGNLHLVLKPEIQVVDGLSVYGRLDLHPFASDGSGVSPKDSIHYNQTGLVFLSKGNSIESNSPLWLLKLSQIYITYQTEFFKLKLGRAPYHFGLGVTYSAETSPLDHWVSVFNQASLYFEYSNIYVQPTLFQKNKDLIGLFQGGLNGDDWSLEALYRYDLKSSNSYVEAFGSYQENNFETQLSVSYFFEDNLKLAVAFEGAITLPVNLSPRLEIKSGYASETFSFHPNYDVALLLWNRHDFLSTTVGEENAPVINGVANGQIKDVIYFSPRISFSFLQETLQVKPLVSVDYQLSSKNIHYELDLQTHYSLEENFSLLFQGGFLRSLDKNYYGLLVQAAVTF